MSKTVHDMPHPSNPMDGVQSLHGGRSESSLLDALTETLWRLRAASRRRDRRDGAAAAAAAGRRCRGGEPGGAGGGEWPPGSREATLSPAEGDQDVEERRGPSDKEREERECQRRVLGVLRELSVLHAERVTAWRGVLREGAHGSSAGGRDRPHPPATDCTVAPCSRSFDDTFLSVEKNVDNMVDAINATLAHLDEEILRSRAAEASAADAALRATGDPEEPERPEGDHAGSDSGRKRGDGGGDATPRASDARVGGTVACDDAEEPGSQGEGREDCVSLQRESDSPEEREKDTNRINKEWIQVGLTGEQGGTDWDVPDACFVRAPRGVAGVLRCEAADALSCLMVTGSEELVSRVIRVEVHAGADIHFPVTIAVPFCARYRGNYRDVAVKIVDGERRASYVTPVTAEGTYGGQRGSFAEVKVYSLGLFAVVSCLKKENFTVPTKGVSLKLTADHRICLNYPPGSFAAPVMAQTVIQPLDAVLLAAVKSRSDAYHPVASTSPLLHLAHPSSQSLRRPLTVTLPCAPPNPEKKRPATGQEEELEDQAPSPRGQSARHVARVPGNSVKSKEVSSELLSVLGSRDQQWSVLDEVVVRNQQNGLVSFELTENFDRLLAVRLLSPLRPCRLASLAGELEESSRCHAVTVVLQRRRDEPRAVLAAALPSRELRWELSRLRARGYGGLSEAASEISMCEGDQLLLRFAGNIASEGNAPAVDRIPFHYQQRSHLVVRLTEVDPFGNRSSPHYKGTAVFYKVTRGQLQWRGDGPVPMDPKLLGDPVCKLSLTLPKRERAVHRPIAVRVKPCEETDSLPDSLLLWLSGELSGEEEVARLVLSLRLRRSAAQLARLRCGDSPSAQAFRVLTTWRRGLPAASHHPKASQLARCLAKSGRPDLARELLLRQAARAGPSSPTPQSSEHAGV
ncbi:death domain-containing protein 1 [Pungitius pungitius]|uniref:death domain-containing protein 1 n=1 Tax=Pungitius pungitius TaxID=134920 RepID=UPI002E10E5D6